MGGILEINRDFRFQIPLPFDDAGMEVLEWLDDASFEWDMYVDLPENCIRYCFRSGRDGVQATVRRCVKPAAVNTGRR